MENRINTKLGNMIASVAILLFLAVSAYMAVATPVGPDAAYYVSNSTRVLSDNYTMNASEQAGGRIYVYNFSAVQTDTRWKGYVGNVSGSLRLSDSSGVLYEWAVGDADFVAEVYATRTGESITWANINCTWEQTDEKGTVLGTSNRTMEENENTALSFTTANDNISATFDARDNVGFWVGSVYIPQDYCYTTNPYSNSASTEGYFEEALLHDGTYLVYATVVNKSVTGYNNEWYDYEMILPENAGPTWTLSTAYYFYVELA